MNTSNGLKQVLASVNDFIVAEARLDPPHPTLTYEWDRLETEATAAKNIAHYNAMHFVRSPELLADLERLERLTIAAKAMIAIVGDGSFVSGGSLRRGAAQLADALK